MPFVVTLPLPSQSAPPRPVRAVPDVRGLDLRDAVRSLHGAGFRVQLGRAGALPVLGVAPVQRLVSSPRLERSFACVFRINER